MTRLQYKLYRAYGKFVLWALRPGLAPLLKELDTSIKVLNQGKVSWNDIEVLKGSKTLKKK